MTERAKNKFTELSEEKKNINREYGRNRYKNMSDEKKQILRMYKKVIVKLIKTKKLWFLVKQYTNSFLILWI